MEVPESGRKVTMDPASNPTPVISAVTSPTLPPVLGVVESTSISMLWARMSNGAGWSATRAP